MSENQEVNQLESKEGNVREENILAEHEITKQGNPRKPEGAAGEEMLSRMNESHYEVTGWALDLWEIEDKDSILDIGCGGGMTLKRMSDRAKEGHLTGVDYSPVSVQESKKLNETDIKSGKMEIIEASVEAMPFAEDTFDKIITVESFYFWPYPSENLKEVHRVLKKDGIFHLVADIYGKEGLNEKQLSNIKEYQLFNPTKEEFIELFTNAGFKRVTIHTKEGTDWICVEGRK